MPSVMIIDGKQYRWTVNSYFTLNTIVAQGTWVKSNTEHRNKADDQKTILQNCIRSESDTRRNRNDLFVLRSGIICTIRIRSGASEFEIDGKTAVPINIENANEDSLFSVKLSSDATYRFKWAIGSKSYTLDKKNVRGDKDQYKLYHTEKLE